MYIVIIYSSILHNNITLESRLYAPSRKEALPLFVTQVLADYLAIKPPIYGQYQLSLVTNHSMGF